MASPRRSTEPAAERAIPATGFEEALRYPLFSAITNRRSRRISKGLTNLAAGTLSYSSQSEPHPLTPEEEALLVAATGITGVTMPDMPFQAPDGSKLLGSPMVEVYGRAASSPDNAQATHFFLINDSGTYLLKRPVEVDPFFFRVPLTPARLVEHVESCKVKVLDRRLASRASSPATWGATASCPTCPAARSWCRWWT